MLYGIQMHIGEGGIILRQPRQFKIMGGEEGEAFIFFQEMTADGEGERKTVESRRAAPDFIH